METYLPTMDDIAAFRAWLVKVPYLDNDVEDSVIAAYIQGAKGRLEKAKSTFDNMHVIRIKYPEQFANLDPQDPKILQTFNSLGRYLALSPNLTDDGCLVVYEAIIDPDALFDTAASFRLMQMCHIRILKDPAFPIKFGEKFGGKVIFVINSKNSRLHHLTFTPTMLKGAVAFMTSALPLRLAAMHIVNISPYVEKFFNMFKKFMKKKVADRIFLHSDESVLKEILPAKCLLKEYGGDLPTGIELQDDLLKGNFAYRENILQWELQMQKLEKLRPKDHEDEDIASGTFRQLQVD